MRERRSFIIDQSTTSSISDRSSARLNAQEKRQIFKGMVVGELEAGFLRYSRRQALLKYAARLGIPEFEACLLIAEAQYHIDDIEPISFNTATTLNNVKQESQWPIPTRLAAALMIAIFVDLLLIYWIF